MFKQYSEQEQKQIEYQWWNEQRFSRDYNEDDFWKHEVDSTMKKLEVELKQYIFDREETKEEKVVKPKQNLFTYVWNRWIRRS
jgi:hypothetical protein